MPAGASVLGGSVQALDQWRVGTLKRAESRQPVENGAARNPLNRARPPRVGGAVSR